MEIWDGHNIDGSLAGVDLVRGEKIPDGLYHLVCEVLVQHTDGDFLLMKRDLNKPINPGKYEATAGGSALKGEDGLTCIKRELYEETGIAVEAKRLLNVYTNFDESYPNGDQVQTVVFLYELQALENVDISNFHNEETLRLGFFSKEEIAELENVSDKHRLMLVEYFSDSFAMGL